MSNKILKTTFLFSFFVLLAQIIGLVRDLYLLRVFGASQILDTYYLAFKIPDLMNIFYSVFLGSVIFIPLLTKVKEESGEEGIVREVRKIGTLVLFLVSFIALFLFIFMPYFAHILAPNWNQEELNLLTTISRYLIIAQFFFPIGILGGAIGMIKDKPVGMAISGFIYNLFILLGTILLSESYGIFGAVFGVILGSIFFAIVQIYPKEVFSIIVKFRFEINFKEWYLFFIKNIGRFISSILNQTFMIAVLILASYAGVGGISIYNNAFNIFLAMYFIGSASFATAIMPQNAKLHISKAYEELKTSFENSLIYTFFLSLVFTLFVYVFSKEIVNLVYYFSELSNNELNTLAITFSLLIFTLPLLNLIEITRKYMYATDLITETILVMTLFLSFLFPINYFLKFIKIPVLDSLSYSIFLANLITISIIFVLLQNKNRLNILTFIKGIYKVLLNILLTFSIYKFFEINFLQNLNNYFIVLIFIKFIILLILVLIFIYLFNDKIGKNILRQVLKFVV